MKPTARPSFFDAGGAFAFGEMAAFGQHMAMNMISVDEQISAES